MLQAIKERFPKNAIDICESLELLLETIESTMENINHEITLAYSQRKFSEIRNFTEIAEDINVIEGKIEEVVEYLAVENNDDIDREENILPDYSAYLVDTNVEYTLYENFTHKRPFGFRINDEPVIEVRTWKEMLLKTCELLIAVDEDKFLKFEKDPIMNGKKRKYFSKNKGDLRKPKLVGNKIYVETNISSNGIRNLLLKLLKKYGYKTNEFKVYLRADYTELHTN